MTEFLLDTNVVSELRKPKPHGTAIEWVGGLRDNQFYIGHCDDVRDVGVGVELLRAGKSGLEKCDTANTLSASIKR